MKSIPSVVYPIALDSDYTLFKVKNSTQSTLAKDLQPEDSVIEIVPQAPNPSEIWPENGFVTIGNELIYYDATGLDENGKVAQLKDCIRGVEGKPVFYHVGTSIASNIVAQTHNQLVDAIMAIEEAIGDIADILKIGPNLKTQQNIRKNLLPSKQPALAFAADALFATPLNASLSSMVGCCPQAGDDTCPDVEFEFNNTGTIAEYCVRIFGNYSSFQIDFGDGTIENAQLSGVHQYASSGTFNPTVTVCAAKCCIVQSPTPPNEFCCGINLPNPSVPFVVYIPDVPEMPEFIAPKQICPGPLLNLPPILIPELTLCPSNVSQVSCCPSLIVSVIEACRTPQVIQIVSPCKISLISLEGCNIPSVISLVGCCIPSVVAFDVGVNLSFEPVCFCEPPSFLPISFAPFPIIEKVSFDVIVDLSIEPICFCEPPSFECISFCKPPDFLPISFEPVCFCEPPSFLPISFAPFPIIEKVSFDVIVDLSIEPICFCEPPSFECISFCKPPDFLPISFEPVCFCEPPSFLPISFAPFPIIEKVSFDVIVDLSIEPICFCEPPSFECISFCRPPDFLPISFAPFPSIGPLNFDVTVDLSIEPICFCEPPSFNCISFCKPPDFSCIDFCPPPVFECISFCKPPNFSCIDFCPPPVFECISFCKPPNFSCIDFCTPPTFACVSFCTPPSFPCIDFCPPPVISVHWGVPPVVHVVCASTTGFAVGPTMSPDDMGGRSMVEDNDIPIKLDELLPSEIKLVVPKISDIKIMHDIPKEILLRGNLPETIKIIGPNQPIPDVILIRGDVPKSIEIVHNLPTKIMIDAQDIPRKILVEPAPNFPNSIKLEVTGMPNTLQVTGIPKTIEIIENLPRTIQLLMPENPEVIMRWNGVPVELKPSPDLEKLLGNLVIPQR